MLKKLKGFYNKYEDEITAGVLILGGITCAVAAVIIHKQDKIIKGLPVNNILAGIRDDKLSVYLTFNDGCWTEHWWSVEKLQQAGIEAAQKALEESTDAA